MVVSLFAYFFCMITALSATAAFLIALSNSSAMESVLHYPRPEQSIIEQFTVSNPHPRDLSDAPRIKKEEVPAKKDEPKKNINYSRVLFAKADTAKRKPEIKHKPERLAHLNKREKPKVLARLRNNYERPSYGNALGYAEESRNGPQRPFFNW